MKAIKHLLSFILLFAVVTSCSDDPASADEDPPELPTFENISPELTYFDQNIPAGSPAYTASVYATSFGYMSQLGTIYTSYFSGADQEQANYKDGTWTWEYNYNWGGESVSVLLESEVTNNEVRWAMTWSYSGTDGSYEDYTIVQGTVALDNSYGTWIFNGLDAETGEEYKLMETTWERESETVAQMETTMYDGDTISGTYLFEWDGVDHTITYNSASDNQTIVIYWNEETGSGYYQDDSGQKCWNSDFEEVACS